LDSPGLSSTAAATHRARSGQVLSRLFGDLDDAPDIVEGGTCTLEPELMRHAAETCLIEQNAFALILLRFANAFCQLFEYRVNSKNKILFIKEQEVIAKLPLS